MLAEAMKRQFGCAFGILEAAMPSFDDGAWRRGKPPFEGSAFRPG